jgi:hypothetical protein
MSKSPVILYLEDDVFQAMSLESTLEDAGYVVGGHSTLVSMRWHGSIITHQTWPCSTPRFLTARR